MNEVVLPGTDIKTTPLGFGCGQLMRVTSRSRRRRLLDAAYDAGIRHFDVARMYGLGAAEAELGLMARERRSELVIATKFGIKVGGSGRRLAGLQGLARRLVGWFPALRRLARARSPALYAPRRYDAAEARESLETSLRALGTDYVDLFMLHEPTVSDLEQTDVLPFLERARAEGKLRAFGIAGHVEDGLAIRTRFPELVQVLQVPDDALTRRIDAVRGIHPGPLIIFSPLSTALPRLVEHLGGNVVARRRWSDAVGADCGSPDILASLLLRYCLQANPSGVVLFSTTHPERVESAPWSAAAGEGRLPVFLDLLQQELRAETRTG